MSAADPAGTLPALVATDLDGTLLRTDGTVSARTRAALAALEDAGVHLVVVTARPPRWVHDLADVVGRHGVVLCANGAFVYRVADRRVLVEHTLAPALVRRLAARLRTELPGTLLAVENVDGFAGEPGYPLHPMDAALVAGPRVREAAADIARFEATASVEDLLDPPPGKLLARNTALAPEVFLARMADLMDGEAVLAFSGADGLAEISAPGVTKAAALADWCAALGVPAERVWTFGDMPNDLSMLTWSGRGHAVANAHPDVLSAADVVCPSNDDDGVARTLEAALAR